MLVPLGDKLIVQPLSPEEQSDGGIILPQNSQTEQNMGTIISIAPTAAEAGLHLGMLVLYSQYAGQPITYKGKDYLVLSKDDIFAHEDVPLAIPPTLSKA